MMAIDSPNDEELFRLLGPRVGQSHLRRRLGVERDCESWVFGQGTRLVHMENWRPFHTLIHATFRLTLLLERARRNALAIELRRHVVHLPDLPAAFDGYRILHLSDLHLDMNESFPDALSERVRNIDYDLCVITGDFRFETYGAIEAALHGMQRVSVHLQAPTYGILGNHDSIRMVPALEAMGVRMLINEAVTIERGGACINLVGIDDAHYYRAHNFDAACRQMDDSLISILLAHTPEVYAQAAHSGFTVMLCGHTHGGQICLPGGIPLITDADCPRRYCRGSWRHHQMQGYTSTGAGSSIVDLRLNCAPEVTLHTLRRIV
jgi:uncharacterized protein